MLTRRVKIFVLLFRLKKQLTLGIEEMKNNSYKPVFCANSTEIDLRNGWSSLNAKSIATKHNQSARAEVK